MATHTARRPVGRSLGYLFYAAERLLDVLRYAHVCVTWDDDAVVRRMKAGQPSGLEALYDRYATMVFSQVLRILRDAQEAEDVTQEVFTRAWVDAARFDPARGAVGAWLTIIARTRALDRLRRNKARGGVSMGPAALPDLPDPAPSAESQAASAEQVRAARGALTALPDELRVVLELAYFEGLTQAEIADRTGVPLGTVKTRIRTGLQRLRDAVAAASTPEGKQQS